MIYTGVLRDIPVNLPWWVGDLIKASEWGSPPWVLNEDSDTLLWNLRWQAWKEETNRAMRDRRIHKSNQHGRR